MTNHPRRLGRRKHQRHSERAAAAVAVLQAELRRRGLLRLPGWTDLTDVITSVRLVNGLGWQPSAIAVRSALDAHREHVHQPRQQQLKEVV